MFVDLKPHKQKLLISECIKKAGSDSKLSELILIPEGSLYFYKNELRKLPKKRFVKLLKFLGKDVNSEIKKVKLLPNNFGQKRGGLISYSIKVKNGTFKSNLKKMIKSSSKKASEWHKSMKEKNKKQYYTMQYERFKKIGGYKYVTKKGEKVRNKLEKDVADFLFGLKRNYVYEPYLEINKMVFFPDFLIDNKIIIECSMWRGYDKAIKLKEKISNFKKGGFRVIIVIDPKAIKFYKSIKDYTVDNLNSLKNEINISPEPAPI